ncbi:hypothetical protein ZIOFF_074038 [Zingiber officinale]|uniref:Integrase catalytic domain-containing protein n=1 Tax=Zingiber officinale TaxID=94328 RepID=A0A8J5C890_ZINOF|nr:hypothetical protein ZIOFF_074038 [Zingiber officinale]
MDLSGRAGWLGIELLNQSNYKVWRSCTESYLVGQDLWDIVNGNNNTCPEATADNSNNLKKWKQLNAKAEFQTFDKLFNKKDEARLQHLENDLAKATQGNLSMSEYFLKVKNLCSEISLLNPEEAISEARIQRNIVRGLRPEYIPFVTSVQGWAQQPSLEELESLSSSQESLAKKMAEVSLKESEGAALIGENACFMAENKTIDAMNSINFDKDWIVDSGCGNHLTGNDTKFSNLKHYSGRQAIVIADNTVHQVKNQGMVIINGKHQDPIMLDNVYHVPRMRKNMFSVANVVDAGHFVLFRPHDMKFLRDIKELKADMMSSNDNPAIWHARLGHVNMEKLKGYVEAELGTKIKRLRTDNGGEFTSNEFSSFCCENGIKRELSCADTPQQNGVTERKIRHLTETCKSWLHAKNFPKAFWEEGMMCAANVINRLPQSPTNKKSPYELMFGKKPNVKHMRVFGSICYVHVPESKRSKLDAKTRKYIFVGYDERKKGWKCLDPTSHRFVVSRDVVFDEVSWYYGAAPVYGDSKSFENKSINLPCPINDISNSSSSSREGQKGREVLNQPQSHHQQEELREEHSERGSSNQSQAQQEEEIIDVENSHRPRRNITKPTRYRDENFISTYS